MADDADSADQPIPIPTGPFYANWGPRDGLIVFGGAPVMGVLDATGPHAKVIGIAWLAGSIPSRKGPAQLFRLTIGKVELKGVFICRCREFVRLGDAAEQV